MSGDIYKVYFNEKGQINKFAEIDIKNNIPSSNRKKYEIRFNIRLFDNKEFIEIFSSLNTPICKIAYDKKLEDIILNEQYSRAIGEIINELKNEIKQLDNLSTKEKTSNLQQKYNDKIKIKLKNRAPILREVWVSPYWHSSFQTSCQGRGKSPLASCICP